MIPALKLYEVTALGETIRTYDPEKALDRFFTADIENRPKKINCLKFPLIGTEFEMVKKVIDQKK